MAAGWTLVSVEEYLATSYKPACDYLDGVLRQKSLPTRKHSLIQTFLCQLINTGFPGFEAVSELTARIHERRYLVPDVAVQRKNHIQDPYPLEPIHLCVEILSPNDTASETFAKCEEYLSWGVHMTWVLDPEFERAWEYRKGQRPHEIPPGGSLTAEGISIPLSDIFSVLHAG